MIMRDEVLTRERFHDRWASTIDVGGIKVKDYFEAALPQNRFILRHMGGLEATSGFRMVRGKQCLFCQKRRCVWRLTILRAW